jgi:hypothetical protein
MTLLGRRLDPHELAIYDQGVVALRFADGGKRRAERVAGFLISGIAPEQRGEFFAGMLRGGKAQGTRAATRPCA